MLVKSEQKSPIQVIERMMKLLEVLAQHPEPLGLKQISQYAGLHPSTAHRILSAMAADRLVDRVEPGAYRLGMRLLELAESLTGNARRIESVADLRDGWFDGVEHVGITSAASTPDDLVQEIVAYFRSRNPELELIEEGEWEEIEFRQPRRLAPRAGRSV